MKKSADIRFARLEDTPAIMQFIHNEWKNGHILSRDKDFFLYEHRKNGAINFLISLDENNNVNATLGFIVFSDEEKPDIATVIWKVADRAGRPMLGIELLQFLKNSGRFRVLMSPGINEKTIGIYKYLGMHTGVLNHYVMINRNLSDFKIAAVNTSLPVLNFTGNEGHQLKYLDRNDIEGEFPFERGKETIPYKDEAYFVKRYFEHPIYTYSVLGIYYDNTLQTLLVTREEFLEDRNILRIVDLFGDSSLLKYAGEALYDIILKNGYEYIDFFCFGVPDNDLISAGFLKIDQNDDKLIIPNYFAPFMQKNITINFFVDTDRLELVKLCKADGDQDRPS